MKQIIIRKNQAEIIVQRPEEHNPQDRHRVLFENFSDKENNHTKKQIIDALRNFEEYNISVVAIRNTATDLLEYLFSNFFDVSLDRGNIIKLEVYSAYKDITCDYDSADDEIVCDYDGDIFYNFLRYRGNVKFKADCFVGVNIDNCDPDARAWIQQKLDQLELMGSSNSSSDDF